MQQSMFTVITAVFTFVSAGSALRCYQCMEDPCVHFDHSDSFIVDCPLSTMCMKKDFYLDIQNEVRIAGVLRGCAAQTNNYQDYENGHWFSKMVIMEPYKEGCTDYDDKGERATKSRECYCRKDLCNASNTNHEGYTDIMGVIVVFNLMKYINSLT